jgi:Ca2+-binding EF-hand superfamily protein
MCCKSIDENKLRENSGIHKNIFKSHIFESTFDQFDSNKDGKLSKHELSDFLKKIMASLLGNYQR